MTFLFRYFEIRIIVFQALSPGTAVSGESIVISRLTDKNISKIRYLQDIHFLKGELRPVQVVSEDRRKTAV